MTKPRHRRLGLSDADAPMLDAFMAWAPRVGWTPEQIEGAIAWYGKTAQALPQMSRAELEESFLGHCRGAGIDATGGALAIRFAENAATDGPEQYGKPAEPARADDLRRLAQLRAQGRDDEFDPAREDEQLEILERLEAGGADLRALPVVPATPRAGNAGAESGAASGAGRLAEIRAFRRLHPDAYDGDAAMQREELMLLSRPPAGSVMAPAAVPAPAPSPAETSDDAA